MQNRHQMDSPENRLVDETSPYLLQHAHNPVDWYPWGDEAFETARREDKPIFLSVGYSACHWCHVMEHESFENEEIARILNENYISIKVDREERPDVDQIYMMAVQLITKRGGWPMSVFMTADGKPFYGGTYWPPTSRMGMPGFRDILLRLIDFWDNNREDVDINAAQLVEAIQEMSAPVFRSIALKESALEKAMASFIAIADRKHGGLGGAPKFPHPMDLRVLLRGWKRFGNQDALDVTTLTLDKMLHGGLYDQLGGGYHRYSTDAHWLVPHFEKMLYDNALLVPVYLEAWQETGNEEYRRAVTETLDYVLREMTASDGGFFSTQDADSEGVEGKFFVWSEQEIDEALGAEDARHFNALYDVSSNGNWEGKNILNRPKSLEAVASELGITVSDLQTSVTNSQRTLLELRSQRIKPGRDEKILVSWNGMMIAAMAKAAFVLNDDRYLAAAVTAAEFVLKNLRDEHGKLVHCIKDGRARFQAYLDDYACLIDGLVELFESSGTESYLVEAIALAEAMIKDYWDSEQGGFFYTASDHESLITRTKEIQDNAVPSGNGMAATALAKLGRLCDRTDFEDVATKTLDAFSSFIAEHPRACGQALIALDFLLGPSQEIVIGEGTNSGMLPELQNVLRKTFLPNARIIKHKDGIDQKLIANLVAGKRSADGESLVYLCSRGECQVPAGTVDQLRQQLSALEVRLS